jgi:hypothetical protein
LLQDATQNVCALLRVGGDDKQGLHTLLSLSDDPRMKIENRMRAEVRHPIDLVGKRLPT